MLRKNYKWFSLIEVLIATSIITVSVFWVYKLIGENSKIIHNAWQKQQVDNLFPILTECLDNIWYDGVWTWWTTHQIDIWLNYNECNIDTWGRVVIDGVDYQLSARILNKNSESIDWLLMIWSDTIKTKIKSYKQLKQ